MRYKLTIEYDGTRYAGWQMQKNARTIQGELISALKQVLGAEDIELYGAGRTDAGVHARGQVAHLEAPEIKLPLAQIKLKINDLLFHDINILEFEKATPRFHARFDAVSREYLYLISKRRDAFGKKYVWWVRDPLNVDAMRAAAEMLQGFHDFRSFGESEDPKKSTEVDLTLVDITEDEDKIYVLIQGSHFLWKMVRRIVGVLVEVGRGNMTAEQVDGFLMEYSREPARFTAPPSGLFLQGVEYA